MRRPAAMASWYARTACRRRRFEISTTPLSLWIACSRAEKFHRLVDREAGAVARWLRAGRPGGMAVRPVYRAKAGAAFADSAVDGGVAASGEGGDLVVGVAARVQDQVAALARFERRALLDAFALGLMVDRGGHGVTVEG